MAVLSHPTIACVLVCFMLTPYKPESLVKMFPLDWPVGMPCWAFSYLMTDVGGPSLLWVLSDLGRCFWCYKKNQAAQTMKSKLIVSIHP